MFRVSQNMSSRFQFTTHLLYLLYIIFLGEKWFTHSVLSSSYTIVHKVCGLSPMCAQTCICCMYYVVHSLFDLSRTSIHLKTHAHLIYERKCTKSLEKMKSMVAEEVLHMPNVTSSVISLAMSKTFLSHHLFNEDGEVPMELLKGEKLNQAMLMFVPLCYPNIRNLISSFKHHSRNMGSFYSILMLKFLSPYDYIQDNYFPKQ